MSALFLQVLNMSITAIWLILAVMILRLFINRVSKGLSCIMWILVGLRLILPFSFKSDVSIVPDTKALPYRIVRAENYAVNSNSPVTNIPVTGNVASDSIDAIGKTAEKGIDTASILSVIWLCVFAALIIYGIVSCILLYRRTSASMRKEDNIYICDDIKGAFIFGIFKPKIYLPSVLEASQRNYVIDHEKAHLKRLDHIWKLLAFLIACLHWFNPFVWLAYILFCRDTELACDERVIIRYNITDKKSYSLALLNCSVPHKKLIATPLAFGEIGVKARIKSVLHYKKPALWLSIIAVVLCVTAAVVLMTDPAEKKQPINKDTGEISLDTEEIPEATDTVEIPEEKYVELDYPQGKTVEEKIAGLPTYDISLYADDENPVMKLLNDNGLRKRSSDKIYKIAIVGYEIPDFAIVAEASAGSGQKSWWIKNLYYKNAEVDFSILGFILARVDIVYDGQCVYISGSNYDLQEEIVAVGPNNYSIIGEDNPEPQYIYGGNNDNMLPRRINYTIDIDNGIVKYTAYHTLIDPSYLEDMDMVLQDVQHFTDGPKEAFETIYSTYGHIEYSEGQWTLVEEGQTTVGALFSDEYLINYMKEHPYGDIYIEYLIEQRNLNTEERE